MKKMTLCVLVVMIACTMAFSQSFHFGIDPGLAISRGSYKPSSGLDQRVYAGFDGGLLFEIGVTPRFMIQPEVNYSLVGVELNNGDKEATIKLRYFDLPVLAKVGLSQKFNLFAGPQIGFLTWAKRDSSFTNELIDLKQDFKNQDFGFVFGGEYKFTPHLFLGTRYYLGLANISGNSNFEMKNRYVSFRLGYRF